jgi:hypothetical protein
LSYKFISPSCFVLANLLAPGLAVLNTFCVCSLTPPKIFFINPDFFLVKGIKYGFTFSILSLASLLSKPDNT